MTCSRESNLSMAGLPPANPSLDIYRVGGAIRDELLGRPRADLDFVVLHCSGQDFCRAFPEAKRVGRQNRAVYHVRGAEFTLSAAPDIQSDLARRDLTINALAQNQNGDLFALDQSWEDLKSRVLRQVKDDNFFQDPVRIFRAARLAADLPDFTVARELMALLIRVGQTRALYGLAPERVGREVLKACAAPNPGRFLRILDQTGTLSPWFRELARAGSIPAGPGHVHEHSLLEHTACVMDLLAGKPLQVWMGLCHDLGKSLTREADLPHHFGHDRAGARLAEVLGDRLRLPREYQRAGHTAARWHMVAGQYDRLRPGTRVDLLMNLKACPKVKDLFSLVKADQGADHLSQAVRDLQIVRSVKLPPEHRGLGRRSGSLLRNLQAQALAQSSFASG